MRQNTPSVVIRILDLDVKRGSDTAETLRRLAREHSLTAEIWSVGCMMEIARWGLAGKDPALMVDNQTICSGGPISEGMLERLVRGILRIQAESSRKTPAPGSAPAEAKPGGA